MEGAQEPGVEPATEGGIAFEQRFQGNGEDGDEVFRQEEGGMEGEEDHDDIQDGALDQNVLVPQRRTHSRYLQGTTWDTKEHFNYSCHSIWGQLQRQREPTTVPN